MAEVFTPKYISDRLSWITRTDDGVKRCLFFIDILTYLLRFPTADHKELIMIAREKCGDFEILIGNMLLYEFITAEDAECYRSFKNEFLERTE